MGDPKPETPKVPCTECGKPIADSDQGRAAHSRWCKARPDAPKAPSGPTFPVDKKGAKGKGAKGVLIPTSGLWRTIAAMENQFLTKHEVTVSPEQEKAMDQNLVGMIGEKAVTPATGLWVGILIMFVLPALAEFLPKIWEWIEQKIEEQRLKNEAARSGQAEKEVNNGAGADGVQQSIRGADVGREDAGSETPS